MPFSRVVWLAFVLFLFAWFPGCGGGGGGGGGGAPEARINWSLIADRLDGVPGTSFRLRTIGLPDATGWQFDWELGDGRVATGASVQASYSSAGAFTVRVRGTSPRGQVTDRTLDLMVFNQQAPELAGLGITLPRRPGDIDGDGQLAAADAAFLAQHLSGAQLLAGDARQAADVDLDGGIDAEDASLLAATVAAGGVMPTRIQPATGPRGTMVRIASSQLNDLAADVQVRVGQGAPMSIRRLYPGYGAFVIPLDAVGAPTLDPIAEATIPADLLVNGTVVDSVTFQLTNPPPVQGDEPARLRTLTQQVAQAASDLEATVVQDAQALGVSVADARVLQALIGYARSNLNSAAASVTSLVANLSPAQTQALGYLCQVGGLPAAEGLAAQLAANPPLGSGLLAANSSAGNPTVNLLYRLDKIVEIAEDIDRTLQLTCAASAGLAALSSVVTGPAGLLLAAEILAACGSVAVASDVVALARTLLPELDSRLLVTADPIATAPTPQWNLRVYVPLKNTYTCNAAAGLLGQQILDLVLERVSRRLTVLISFEALQSIPFDLRTGELRSALVDFVRDALAAIGTALDGAGVLNSLTNVKNQVCAALAGADALAVRIDELESLTFSPAGVGREIIEPPVGVLAPAVYRCNPTDNGSVRIEAALAVAGQTRFTGGVDVQHIPSLGANFTIDVISGSCGSGWFESYALSASFSGSQGGFLLARSLVGQQACNQIAELANLPVQIVPSQSFEQNGVRYLTYSGIWQITVNAGSCGQSLYAVRQGQTVTFQIVGATDAELRAQALQILRGFYLGNCGI